MNMKYEYTYIKQAESRVLGHVYEHAIANLLEDTLYARGLLPVLDYRLDAYTHDGIVILFIDFNDGSLVDSIPTILQTAELSAESIKVAVVQVSCEYERLATFEPSALFAEIRQLHALPWSTRDDFVRTKPITDAARELVSAHLSYGRYSPKSFAEYSIVYELKDCPFELKPIAVYVIQMLAISQLRLMNESVKYCYDIGDEWVKYQDLVGYTHSFRIPKNQDITLEEFTALEIKQRRSILEQDFVHRLSDYILRDAQADYPYFTTSVMFANSYQIIGKKGWQEIVTEQNVRDILHNVTINTLTD